MRPICLAILLFVIAPAPSNQLLAELKEIERDCPPLLSKILSSSYHKLSPEEFSILFPSLMRSASQFVPGLGKELTENVEKLKLQIKEKGLASLPPFAIRGIRGEGKSPEEALKLAQRRGYLGEDGGNFYMFSPQDLGEGITEDNFVMRLYGSVSSVGRYASSKFPIVIAVDLQKFPIINSKGNDGIDSSFPSSFNFANTSLATECLDVGMVTRTGVRLQKKVTRANAIPESVIFRKLSPQELPKKVQAPSLLDDSSAKFQVYQAWILNEFLKSYLKLIP